MFASGEKWWEMAVCDLSNHWEYLLGTKKDFISQMGMLVIKNVVLKETEFNSLGYEGAQASAQVHIPYGFIPGTN